ncbi:MAG: polysaccharide biosynthesis tyrosine autokinase [Actinomycetota bacterium]|nr:polysaccharide biosynthesis tyrosine autokinase [Actinomycetota bacterium]
MEVAEHGGPSVEDRALSAYLEVVRRRKWVVFAAALVVVATAGFFVLRQVPIYTAQAEVFVKSTSTSATSSSVALPPNLETERKLASSTRVALLAEESLQWGVAPKSLLEDLTVSVAANTEILVIEYSHPQARKAQRGAQGFAHAYLQYRRAQVVDDLLASSEAVQQRSERLNAQLARVNAEVAASTDADEKAVLQVEANSLVSQIAILQQKLSELTPPEDLSVGQIVVPSELPSAPSSPNYPVTLGLALCIGIFSGLGLAFVRERLDDRLTGPDEIETHLRAPVLAVVPRVRKSSRRKAPLLVTSMEGYSAASEAYRSLRTGLLFSSMQGDIKSILITSAHAGEGKSTTTANLGIALAQADKNVIMVSADLRKPSLHSFFGRSNETGLSDVLIGNAGLEQAVPVRGNENLRLLPSGRVPVNPTELLTSHAMEEALQYWSRTADYVLIDAPPVLAASDAAILAARVDAVLVVIDVEANTKGTLEHVRRQLDQVQANVIGAVTNKFDPSKTFPYSYYYREGYTYSNGNGSPSGGVSVAATGREDRRD